MYSRPSPPILLLTGNFRHFNLEVDLFSRCRRQQLLLLLYDHSRCAYYQSQLLQGERTVAYPPAEPDPLLSLILTYSSDSPEIRTKPASAVKLYRADIIRNFDQ